MKLDILLMQAARENKEFVLHNLKRIARQSVDCRVALSYALKMHYLEGQRSKYDSFVEHKCIGIIEHDLFMIRYRVEQAKYAFFKWYTGAHTFKQLVALSEENQNHDDGAFSISFLL